MNNLSRAEYTYSIYKEGTSTFWSDIPCTVYRKNCHRKQRSKWKLSSDCIRSRYSSTNICPSFKAKKKVKKKKKHVTQNGLRYLVHSKVNKDEISTDYARQDNIPVYFKSPNKSIKLVYLKLNTMDSILTTLSNLEGIDRNEMMVGFYGRILCSARLAQVKPYDQLDIIIKGYGGMLEEKLSISKSSSEEEIMEWLKTVVGLSLDDIDKFSGFRFLDGETLFSYEDTQAKEFQADIEIPIGLSRKILLLRKSSAKLKNILQSELAKWDIKDVESFVRQSSVQSPEVDEICSLIQDKYIDGLVFIAYENPKELQTDLQKTDKFGIIYKRIIAKRDRIFKIDHSLDQVDNDTKKSSVLDKSSDLVEKTEEHKTDEQEKPLVIKDVSRVGKDDAISDEWASFLNLKLHLQPCDRNKNKHENYTWCRLNIIHADWKNRNLLETKIIFFVLVDENDITNLDQFKRALWDRIRKDMTLWKGHFVASDKNRFMSSLKDDTLLLDKKPFSLSKSPVKLRYPMEKSLVEISNAENIFLIVSKTILNHNTNEFITYLENPIGKKKNHLVYRFTFEAKHIYWFFDPEDYSYGFRLEKPSMNFCGDADVKLGYNKEQEQKDEEITEIETISNNTVALKDDKNELYPLCKNETISVFDDENEKTSFQNIQMQRMFKTDGTDIQYNEGWRIATAEHDGSVSFQCFEFKFVPDSLIAKGCHSVIQFFNKEIIRYACGCLNARKNGTIMFGIGDSYGTSDGMSRYCHGEVVGIPIDGMQGDFRAEITMLLRTAIEQCFENHCFRTASRCIGNPVFVQVISQQPSCQKCIVEVDIEPSSALCKDDCFKINRSKLITGKDIEKELTIYVREDVGTVKKKKIEERLFLKTDLMDIIRRRLDDEKQMLMFRSIPPDETPMDKLRKMLCKGSNKFDKSIWPILVLSKPTNDQKRSDEWLRCLKFIKIVDFHAVFDFDDDSNDDGLCSVYGKKEKIILQDNEIFQEFSGRKLDLATKLEIPHSMKTIWIFSNGRSDIKPPKVHERRAKWTDKYSAGIRDAVIFFSQKDIIPNGRALVIILLFSNNFEGLIETFREITIRFGWEQITIISTDNTLSRFIYEYQEHEDNIQKCSISGKGVTWEHINSTFFEITGFENQGNIFLTTSSGAYVPADEKFVETLTEFQIISARQCEDRKFKSLVDQEEFSSEIEVNFYRGEKVDWFNFYFETHVLKRHYFDRLKNTIGNILQSSSTVHDRDKRIISTVIIAHEPGAGGTTLARHILWEFHKQYRCAIITKITDRTAKHVLSLLQHKETSNTKPLLLLIDELLQSNITFEGLIRQLHNEYRSDQTLDGLVCCFLVCQQENVIQDEQTNDSQLVHRSGNVVEQLKQKLTDDEIDWMDRKYEKLEKKGAKYKPQYLLSFMILREGFNQEYIKNTIKNFLTRININSNEFELLECASLVSAYRRVTNVFIPLECCDVLMGSRKTKTVYWEKTMSSILKMFLIVEQKASGMQIRMAHPALAKAVLQQILDNKKESLSLLTQRFLDSSILDSPSYGRETILEFTKEMLLRRLKEEYNDEKTTSFSPLIETICKEENWISAFNVLKKGFEKIKDTFMAQTLARLSSKNADFDQAIFWAEQAVMLSEDNKTNKGYALQIFAVVLDEKFTFQTKKVNSVTPRDAVGYISLIMEAIDTFIEASRLRKGTADHMLYPIMGCLNSILRCLKFIEDKVILTADVDLKLYLADDNYLPEEIEVWETFKPKFLKFSVEGDKAFEFMEQCLCLYTTYYAHDIKKKHRLYRILEYRYLEYFKDFSSFFGANKDQMSQSTIPEVLNNWHRRRLIQLGGNSYMNICNILRQIRTRCKDFNSVNGIAQCVEIKKHLSKLTDRTPKDLSNLVSVNIVLGLLRGKQRESTKTIIGYCKQIIKMRKGYEDLANFFISLLLWPSSQMGVDYDDNLFYDSIRYLSKTKDTNRRTRESKYSFLKEERNVTKPTSQFFLTNGRGFESLCYRLDIFYREETAFQFDSEKWDHIAHKNNLKLLTGSLKFYDGQPYIQVKNEKSTTQPYIKIRKFRTGKTKDFMSEEDVHFYLGFSIAGPLAYNIKPIRYAEVSIQSHNIMADSDAVEKYISDETVETLQQKIDLIENLKIKLKEGKILSEKHEELVRHEEDIKTALEVKRGDPLPY